MNTPDIDIERLREAVEDAPNLYDNAGDIATLVRAARFLVSLADQGGELWSYRPCDHGLADGLGHFIRFTEDWCPGGSRVRVWPKETE